MDTFSWCCLSRLSHTLCEDRTGQRPLLRLCERDASVNAVVQGGAPEVRRQRTDDLIEGLL